MVNSWLAISLQFCLTVLRKCWIDLENYVCKVACHFSRSLTNNRL